METRATLENLNIEMNEWLSWFFSIPTDEEGNNIDYEIHTRDILSRLFNIEWETASIDDCVENLGAKWVDIIDPEIDLDNPVQTLELDITSAWSFPKGLIEEMFRKLSSMDQQIVIKGEFYDETYAPTGVFYFSKNVKEIKIVFTESIDEDRMWDDDDYREKIQEELNEHLFILQSKSDAMNRT